MNSIEKLFLVFEEYFEKSMGVKKYINSSGNIYDYILLFTAALIVILIILYIFWPAINKYLMNRKLIDFIVYYKDIDFDEKHLVSFMARKYNIKPVYMLYIDKNDFDEVFARELKKKMLNQENESDIKEFIYLKDSLRKKLFSI